MGLFNFGKKKETKEIVWKDSEEFVKVMSVEYYIKRILNHNDRSDGVIWFNDDKAIPFSHGNLGDIVSSSISSKQVQNVKEDAENDQSRREKRQG